MALTPVSLGGVLTESLNSPALGLVVAHLLYRTANAAVADFEPLLYLLAILVDCKGLLNVKSCGKLES